VLAPARTGILVVTGRSAGAAPVAPDIGPPALLVDAGQTNV
jgi:hypothetical protein